MTYKLIHIYTDHDCDLEDLIHVDNQTRAQFDLNSQTNSLLDLLTSVENPIPSTNENQPEIDYDTEGTDEDDVEVVNARDRVREEKNKHLSYDKEFADVEKGSSNQG